MARARSRGRRRAAKIRTIPGNGKILKKNIPPPKVQRNFMPGEVRALRDIRAKPEPPTRGF